MPSAELVRLCSRVLRGLALLGCVCLPDVVASRGAEQPAASSRLQRDVLLEFVDEQGKVQSVGTPEQWLRRRKQILEAMQQIMGPLPGHDRTADLDLHVEDERDGGTFVIRRISYLAEPGGRVPAYLLVPKRLLGTGDRAPGILCLHPTNLEIGPQVVAGLGGRDQMHYGRELAERGYVVLAPCYPRMAGYEPDLEKLGYVSTTMKAIWDNLRGVDLLESLPAVQPGGVGTIGHSLGGHNAVYTAVFDERIRVVVSSCGLDSYRDYKQGDIRGWTSKWYMPRLIDYRDRLAEIPFDFHEMIAALAPRHVYINAPLRDDNFQWQSVDRVVEAARPVFRLHGVEGHLRVEHPDCGHDFPAAQREAAFRLFDQVLRGKRAP